MIKIHRPTAYFVYRLVETGDYFNLILCQYLALKLYEAEEALIDGFLDL
jgi:hypothetical protein